MHENQTTPIAETTTAPSIVALENPTAEQLLREQLAAAVRENMQLVEAHDGMIKKFEELTGQRDALKAQLAEMEKSPLIFALNRMDSGSALRDANERLTSLLEDIKRRGEKGKFTLIFTVEPQGNALIFEPEIKVAAPKPDAPRSIFFLDNEGQLSRQDKDQRKLKFDDDEDAD